MNRDEQRNRPEANMLSVTDTHCFPVDERSQGTWFGINAHGLAIALLNRYQDTHHHMTAQSRGTIIPILLKCSTFQKARTALDTPNLNDFNPFDLIILNKNKYLHATWDRECLNINTHTLNRPFFITSSSERGAEIIEHRHAMFRNFIMDKGNIIKDLHLNEDQNDKSSSILMNRENTHTKSIVQATLSSQTATIQYWTEDVLADARGNLLEECAQRHEFIFTKTEKRYGQV